MFRKVLNQMEIKSTLRIEEELLNAVLARGLKFKLRNFQTAATRALEDWVSPARKSYEDGSTPTLEEQLRIDQLLKVLQSNHAHAVKTTLDALDFSTHLVEGSTKGPDEPKTSPNKGRQRQREETK